MAYDSQVSWFLLVAFGLSLVYELYRAVLKSKVSKFDTKRAFVTQSLPFYVVAFVVAVLVRIGGTWTVWAAFVFVAIALAISIFYYSPRVLPQRVPGFIDWVEDKVYTGLLFVAEILLVYRLFDKTLIA